MVLHGRPNGELFFTTKGERVFFHFQWLVPVGFAKEQPDNVPVVVKKQGSHGNAQQVAPLRSEEAIYAGDFVLGDIVHPPTGLLNTVSH